MHYTGCSFLADIFCYPFPFLLFLLAFVLVVIFCCGSLLPLFPSRYLGRSGRVWSVSPNQRKKRVLYLAMSPDGQTIVTGAGDETLRFWNAFPGPKSREGSGSAGLLFPAGVGIR